MRRRVNLRLCEKHRQTKFDNVNEENCTYTTNG